MTMDLNARLLGKLLVIAMVMFGFGFAMVPLYRAICEITGINQLTRVDEDARRFAENTQVDTSRRVTIEFDANGRGPWQFRPRINALSVHPGELVTVTYELVNATGRDSTGQAIPSYAPSHSAQYVRKVECFCFQQQALGAGERRAFPVVFVVDPKLPHDIANITLSYTFFEIDAPVAPAPRASAAAGRG